MIHQLKNMRILELTNFSAGGCGVFARVKEESLRLSNLGHTVKIFSSNLEKGTWKIVAENEKIGRASITRFKAKRLGGESYIRWNFEEEALRFKPDIIIAHGYRHIHTLKALKLKNKLDCKVILVTHAPFGRNKTRSQLENTVVYLFDNLIGRKTINKFDRVIAITKWEMPFLKEIGLKEDKTLYIPNGIRENFFKDKKISKEQNKLIYTGRIVSIKDLEVVIEAFEYLKDKKIIFELLGPADVKYLLSLIELVKAEGLENKVFFNNRGYNIKEQIKFLDSGKIFVLPSISEGMPQVLIEAMAR